MYKLLLPGNQIMTFKGVVACVEKHVEFAGRKCRLTKRAGKKDKANLLVFDDTVNADPFMNSLSNPVVIGNLAPEKVSEITEALLKDGYYDFSKVEFQDVEKYINLVVDNGVSLPYMIIDDFMFHMPIGRGEMVNCNEITDYVTINNSYSYITPFGGDDDCGADSDVFDTEEDDEECDEECDTDDL